MILILIGALFAFLGVFVLKRVLKGNSENLYAGKLFLVSLNFFFAIMFITFGFCAARHTEGEDLLKGTYYVEVQKFDNVKYEVFDEENNVLYYVADNKVEVLKGGRRGMYGNKIIYDCTIVEGDYDKPYIEYYEIDYKVEWWSFELTNGVKYVFYIPKGISNN